MTACLAVLLTLASVQAEPCERVQRVLAPCDGQLVPHADAAKMHACLTVDFPGCEEQGKNKLEQAALTAQDLRSELSAAKAYAESQRRRADRLGELLEGAVSIPEPAVVWWQTSEFVVTLTVVAVGSLTAAIVLAVK